MDCAGNRDEIFWGVEKYRIYVFIIEKHLSKLDLPAIKSIESEN